MLLIKRVLFGAIVLSMLASAASALARHHNAIPSSPNAGPWGGPGYGGYWFPGYGSDGMPAYGYGVVPNGYAPSGYGAPAARRGTSASDDKEEQAIEALERRIKELERHQVAPQYPSVGPGSAGSADGGPSVPAFRPMGQY